MFLVDFEWENYRNIWDRYNTNTNTSTSTNTSTNTSVTAKSIFSFVFAN